MHAHDEPACQSRRDFLLNGGKLVMLAAASAVTEAVWAQRAGHAPLAIARLSALKAGEPYYFEYPQAGDLNMLVKLGVPAGGGIGPQADVVAFSTRCTHLGGKLQDTLQAGLQVLGPCPRHLTTFDLSRHGVVITGHATASLPQVVLELDGDQIRAIGMQGLVYPDRSRHA
ncbi:MAG: Rieske 2Fe-2S domain-containing protein [Betaproteobacteria bacterium]|nr:Rieske 2Fe-2S domain-containing protein [Betaproteobacteria bacterium]